MKSGTYQSDYVEHLVILIADNCEMIQQELLFLVLPLKYRT